MRGSSEEHIEVCRRERLGEIVPRAGPKGLDAAIVSKVNTAVKTALETPSVQKRLVEMGNTPRWESPEQFRQTVKTDRQKWASVVKEVGATID